MPKRFLRRKESFVCEHCGHETAGNGYTNHCPKCLWSKHVDRDPGDRSEPCGGMMEPIRVEMTRVGFRITHHCTVCGMDRANRAAADDDSDVLIAIAKRFAERAAGRLKR